MKVPEMMKSALEAAASDPMFSMDLGITTPGNLCSKLAKDLLLSLTENGNFSNICDSFAENIWSVLLLTGTTDAKRDKLCSKFLEATAHKSLTEQWSRFIGVECSDTFASNMLFQFVADRFFQSSLKWRTETLLPLKERTVDTKLTVEEEKTVRYVAMLRMLKKLLRKQSFSHIEQFFMIDHI